jgi:hypothetical protein
MKRRRWRSFRYEHAAGVRRDASLGTRDSPSRLLKCAVRKAQDSSGRVERKPTRQISLQPEAIGAGEEATRRPKPSMEKAPLKGVSERAGRNRK